MPKPTSSQSEIPPSPELRNANSLPVAVLLSMAGGSIDAFVYLNHGHVFAAVMTGDTILLAVGLLQHDWSRSLHNLVPIIAFLAGLFCAHLFHYVTRSRYVILGLAGEALGLFAVSFLPGSFPDRVFVAFVSFLTAYQVASFRKEEGKRYNSTFVTADLRSLVDGLDDILQPAKRRQGLQKARQLGLIFLSFFTGALIAAFLAPRIYNHTLWFADLLLTSVVAFILVRSRSSNLSPHE